MSDSLATMINDDTLLQDIRYSDICVYEQVSVPSGERF